MDPLLVVAVRILVVGVTVAGLRADLIREIGVMNSGARELAQKLGRLDHADACSQRRATENPYKAEV